MDLPVPGSYYTIQDENGRPIQCPNDGGNSIYTSDSLNGDDNQNFLISNGPNETSLVCYPTPGNWICLDLQTESDGEPLVTSVSGIVYWSFNDDGSISLNGTTGPDTLYLSSLSSGSNQLTVSKTKQTWKWNPKSQKGSSGY